MNSTAYNIPNRTSQDIRYLQNLADTLDLHLGVGTRKQILEGNERLTLATDEQTWVVYFSEVMQRLDASINPEKKAKIFSHIDYFANSF